MTSSSEINVSIFYPFYPSEDITHSTTTTTGGIDVSKFYPFYPEELSEDQSLVSQAASPLALSFTNGELQASLQVTPGDADSQQEEQGIIVSGDVSENSALVPGSSADTHRPGERGGQSSYPENQSTSSGSSRSAKQAKIQAFVEEMVDIDAAELSLGQAVLQSLELVKHLVSLQRKHARTLCKMAMDPPEEMDMYVAWDIQEALILAKEKKANSRQTRGERHYGGSSSFERQGNMGVLEEEIRKLGKEFSQRPSSLDAIVARIWANPSHMDSRFV